MTTQALQGHTPGPWHIPEDMTYTVKGPKGGDQTIVSAMNGRAVSADEAVANARLIAAAPAMLDLLSGVVDQMDSDGAVGVQLLTEIRAAIAQATGQ